jgi:hypothetical protein
MAKMLCLSDLHLGDNKSALNDSTVASKVTTALASFTKCSVDVLVLNGDIWEQCIPAGTLEENPGDGFVSSVAKTSRGFFEPLFRKIDIGTVVWVPGNHDLSLWKRLSTASELPFLTSPSGETLAYSSVSQVKKFYDVLFGTDSTANIPAFKVAYPSFIAVPDPSNFPYTMFTHGHLLDALVRGEESEAVYLALRALGCGRSTLPTDPENALSLKGLAAATDEFTLSLWKQDSAAGYTYWNMISRRLAHPQSCSLEHQASQIVTKKNHPSSPRDGLMPSVQGFLEMVVMDPSLPTPVGSLRSETTAPAFKTSSCLVFGHDHLGTASQVAAYGVPFSVFDSGGWTKEFDGHVPHTHALVWEDDDIVPTYLYLALD